MSTELGMNQQPHELHAMVQRWGNYAGIKWRVVCPYPASEIHDCGLIENCTGSEQDVAKYGCRPYPVEPKYPEGFNHMSDDLPEDFVKAFRAWEDDVVEWQCEHIGYGGGEYGHRIGECWFTHVMVEGDLDAENFLAHIPEDTPIISPLLVHVAYEGHYDETEPVFELWKDPNDNAR